jgi:hypothetical protein
LAGTGSHPVTYTYTDVYSCSNSSTQNITVNAVPSVNFTLTDSDFCINEPATSLSAFPSGGSFSGTGISGSSFNPAMAGAGNHNLIYSYTDGNLCTNKDTAVAIVHALPVVSISSYPDSICINGLPDTLSGLPVGGTFGGQGINGNIFYPNSAGLGNHTVVYNYTDTYNCHNSDTVNILVNNISPLTILSGLSSTNCQNDTAYKLSITPAGGTYSVNYIINDTFYPNLAPVGHIGYIYTYTNAHGCSTAIDDSAFVYANPQIDAGSDTLLPCNSNGAVLGEMPQTGFTYVWSPVAGLNNPFIANPTANPWVDTTVYTVVKTDLSNQCKGYDSVMITIPNPPLVAISGDTSVCMNDTVHLSASGASTYLWKYGISGSKFDQVLPITQYISVTGTDTNNCIGKDSVLVLVNLLPNPNLGNDTAFYSDSIILFPGNYSNYIWNTGDTSSTLVIQSSQTPGTYTYWVNVTDFNGCKGNDTIVIKITTGFAQAAGTDAQIKVYPNPSKGLISLEWSEVHLNLLEVYDNAGRLIMKKKIEHTLTESKIDLRATAKGAYFIRLQGDDFVRVVKVLLE